MKIKNKNNRKKMLVTVSVLIGAILVLCVAYGVFAKSTNSWPFSKPQDTPAETKKSANIDLMPATDEQKESAGGDKKDTPITSGDADKNPTPPLQQPTPENTSSKQNVSVTVTNYSSEGSALHVNAVVNTLTAGICTATIVKNGTIIGAKTGNTFAQ